jgi:hypothetical protein
MKSKLIIVMVTFVIAYPYMLTRGSAVGAGTPIYAQSAGSFSAEELDNLLAPIALYPDPLLAQILPASTFVDQIQQAAAWVKTNHDPARINSQQWDTSVKALAGFPDVLNKMNEHLDWTTALGQAYVAQSSDVSTAIQRLRTQAKNSGALTTTPQQTVAVDQGNVTIMPAQSNQIYVPQYDAGSVWGSTGAAVAGGLLTFGAGIALGGWWNNGWNRGWDWGRGGIYNVNRSAVALNRGVMNRSINAGNLNRFNNVHRNTDFGRHARVAPTGRTGTPGRLGKPGAGVGGRTGTPGRLGTPGAGVGGRTGTPGRVNAPGAGVGGNRLNTSGMRGPTPGARPGARQGAAVNRPTGQRGGGGRAAAGGGRKGGGGGRRR